MLEFERELLRGNYELFLQKTIRQRPEHIASAIKRYPHMYGYIFVYLTKWDAIPVHFMEVKRAIERSGRRIDGRLEGTYCLTLHGKRSCGKPSHVRYLSGCKLLVSISKGIQVRDIRCNILPFKWLLQTARIYDTSGEPLEDLDKPKKHNGRCFGQKNYW